jgi:hypothetical protein
VRTTRLAKVVDLLAAVDRGGDAGLASFELQRQVEGVAPGLVQVPAVVVAGGVDDQVGGQLGAVVEGSSSSARPPSALVLQGVADGLHADQAVAEDEGVEAVLDAGRGGVRGPFQEQHVILVNLGLQIPGRVRHVGEQLGEGRPDAVLAAPGPGRRNEDRIVGVVSDDLVQIACAE